MLDDGHRIPEGVLVVRPTALRGHRVQRREVDVNYVGVVSSSWGAGTIYLNQCSWDSPWRCAFLGFRGGREA